MKPLAALLSFLTFVPFAAPAADISVFAAASLRGALEDIAQSYPTPVHLSFGGSGTIARQVASGAPADVVVLAHDDWMDWLATRTPLGVRTSVATNRLVLVGPAGAAAITPDDIAAKLGTGKLAMGQRDAVPAGTYARQWLQSAGVWEELLPYIAETDNVSAALALVAQGATPMGIVYASDALAEPRVTVLYSVPETSHDPITYPLAALTAEGEGFATFLQSDIAGEILIRHGFIPVAQ